MLAKTTTLPASKARSGFFLGSVLMILSLVAFTGNALLVRHLYAAHHVKVWTAILVRSCVGLLFVLALFQRNGSLRLSRVFTRPMLASRGVVGAIGMVCYYWSIPALGVGLATLLANTYVLFAAVMAAFLLKERLTPVQGFWMAVALFGVALLTNASAGLGLAEAVALFGAVLAGVVVVGIRHLRRTESAATIYAAQCVYSALLSLPLVKFAALPWPVMGLLIVAGLLATLGQLGLTEAFRYLTVSVGGAYNLTLPIWVTIGGMICFGETLTAWQIVGAALVLGSCFLSMKARRGA